MPSPFPGMDPYLEEPAPWGGVHSALISILRELLARQVSPRFFVASETSITAPVLMTPVMPAEIRQHYLEIRERDTRQVVTTIEVVSPVNKAPGSNGFDEFYRKRQRIMTSATHWIEIVLLRAGQRPAELRDAGDYYALLKRGTPDAQFEVWPFNLRDRPPTIAVPLIKPLPDVPIDLKGVIDTAYDRYHYDDGLDYASPLPPPPLDAADQRWVAECIHAWHASRSG